MKIDEYEAKNLRKKVNEEISETIKTALDKIETGGHFAYVQTNEERETAWNLYELLEKSVHTWDDEMK